jgi:hypothetical protein
MPLSLNIISMLAADSAADASPRRKKFARKQNLTSDIFGIAGNSRALAGNSSDAR